MRLDRKLAALVAAAAVVVGAAAPAYAWQIVAGNNVTEGGQTVYAWLDRDGKRFQCLGKNSDTDGDDAYEIHVSYVCQYKDNGTWYDFPNVEGYTESNYWTTGTQLGPDNNPCTGNDGPPNLGSGEYQIRAQADGYLKRGVHSARNHFRGDGAMHTESVTVDCA